MGQSSSQTIDPADFTTHIDNPYMTLRVGTTFITQDFAAHSYDAMTVTHHTKVIDGVTCVVVRDTEWVNGDLSEDTRDYFAQDKDGNVWYFGEHAQQYEPGNPDPVGHEGSWLAGKHGAAPGIAMEANPQVGDRYHQENAPGRAEDRAEVISLDAHCDVGYGQFDNMLKTREHDQLDPGDIEHKYYAHGLNLLSTDVDGAFEQLTDIFVDGRAGDDHLRGYFGGDVMRGRAGDDIIQGKRGADSIAGGPGDNTLYGGSGADTFVFHLGDASAHGTDTIADYSAAEGDAIHVRGGTASVAAETQIAHGWALTLSNGRVIDLVHVRDSNHDGHIVDNLIFS